MDESTLANPTGKPKARAGTPSLADVLALQTVRTKTIRACVDGAAVDRLEALEAELVEVREDDEQSREIAEQIEQLRDQANRATFAWKMQALAPLEWSDLVAEHSARKGKSELFNADTFPMAAVAACCVEPTGIDQDSIEELWNRLSVGDRGRLFSCAWEANTEVTSLPNSPAASALLRIFGRNSTTAGNAASREASS